MKKVITVLLCCLLCLCFIACAKSISSQESQTSVPAQITPEIPTPAPSEQEEKEIYLDPSYSTEQRVSDLLSRMSLEDKAAQMVQGEQAQVSNGDIAKLGLGSVLSGGGSVPGNNNTLESWQSAIDRYQDAALSRELKIPFIYGADAVHGHNTVYGAVIFPHNIGIGAANDEKLTQQMGAYVAEEMKLTGVLWNFGPCVAVVQDPRWGRTYESFSSDSGLVSEMALAYIKGQQSGGVLSTAKHFAGDGGTAYGTGAQGTPLDQGDVIISEQQFRDMHLAPYKRLVGEGLQCVMVSFNSYNGLKMHENKHIITDILKDEYGFKGFVVSDWEGVKWNSASTYEAKVIASVNAGIDMLMEPYEFNSAIGAIVNGVKNGDISEERVNDAVSRILTVKFDMGLFEDPYLKNAAMAIDELGSTEGRSIAEKLVEKSQVLLKNDDGLLPLKQGQKIYVLGPAADSVGVQCGGWTISWRGMTDKDLTPGTTILEGLQQYAGKCGFEIITDKTRANEADVVLLAIGETPYAEFEGDTADLSITGSLALEGNEKAIEEAESLGKPVVTLIVAGRNVLISDYIDDWDAAVMCYLPGTEGGGIVATLTGQAPFTGKLPMPWYKSVDDIGKENPDLQYELGYGLSY